MSSRSKAKYKIVKEVYRKEVPYTGSESFLQIIEEIFSYHVEIQHKLFWLIPYWDRVYYNDTKFNIEYVKTHSKIENAQNEIFGLTGKNNIMANKIF